VDKKALKKTVVTGIAGFVIGVLFVGLMMAGPYPEGTTFQEVVAVHLPMIIGGGFVGTIVAWIILFL